MPEGELTYGLMGHKIGNQQTCEAQAFIIYLSWGYTVFTNLFLNVYYLCTIRYNVNNVKFRAYAEPAFILLSTTFSIVMPIYFLKHGAFGADQNLETYCTMIKIDDTTHSSFLEYYSISFLGSLFIVILCTMVLIISTVWRGGDLGTGADDFIKHQRHRIAFQAVLYVLSFLLTWVFTIITMFIRDSPSLEAARYIFMPSQGIFNLIIFTMHKVHAARANENEDEKLTTWQTIYYFFKNPEKFRDRHMIANMELIENDIEKMRSEQTMHPTDTFGLRRHGMQTQERQSATHPREERADDECISSPSIRSEDFEYEGLSNLLDPELSVGVSSTGIFGPPSAKQDIENEDGGKVYKNVTFNKDCNMAQDSCKDVIQKQQKKVSHQSEEESIVSSLSKDATVSGRAKI